MGAGKPALKRQSILEGKRLFFLFRGGLQKFHLRFKEARLVFFQSLKKNK